MTAEEASERIPTKSPWTANADGKWYTVVGHQGDGDDLEIVYSLTTDGRVRLAMPVADFLASFTRVP